MLLPATQTLLTVAVSRLFVSMCCLRNETFFFGRYFDTDELLRDVNQEIKKKSIYFLELILELRTALTAIASKHTQFVSPLSTERSVAYGSYLDIFGPPNATEYFANIIGLVAR